MNDWDDVIKPFGRIPVEKDTTHNTKPLHLEPARAIGLVGKQITVPAITLADAGNFQVPYITYQYNYTMPNDFRVINFVSLRLQTFNLHFCTVCIRYRVGTTVYRYILLSTESSLGRVPAPLYNGQLIKANFVIEVWQLLEDVPYGIVNALTLMTSLIRIPTGQDDYLPDNFSNTEIVTLPQLQASILPEALPTTYDESGSWLTN